MDKWETDIRERTLTSRKAISERNETAEASIERPEDIQTTDKTAGPEEGSQEATGTADDRLNIVMESSAAIQDLVGLIRQQTAKGLAKYPEEFKEENFSIVEVLDHYAQEMVDGLLYIRALRRKMLRLSDIVERDLIAKSKPGFNT